MTGLLTVRDLVDMPTLGQRVLAGAAGLDRVVLWAHSCEMPDPWRWLGPDELLMTVGLCVPEDAEAQVEFVRRLAAAGLAGVTIGDDDPAPPIAQAALAEADRLGFPVLRTSHAVPFVTVGRTVALAGDTRQQQQLLLINRLYRVLTSVRASSREAVEQMEDIFGIRLAVLDTVHRGRVLPGSLELDDATTQALCASAAANTLPAGSALPLSGRLRAWPLPSDRQSVLVLEERSSAFLDAFLTGHLLQAVTAAVNGVVADTATRAARAEQLFSAVLLGQTPLRVLLEEAHALGFDGQETLVAVAVAASSPDDAVVALAAAGVQFLPRRTHGRLLCCMRAGDLPDALELLASTMTKAGVSGPFESLTDAGKALRDAVWALESAGGQDTVMRYDDVRGSILPRDAQAAREISVAVLGPLLDDNERAARLLETLTRFLDHDRSWNDTAAALGVHRQTLAHRLRRIEELTGRSLKSSADIAVLWVATKALQQSDNAAW